MHEWTTRLAVAAALAASAGCTGAVEGHAPAPRDGGVDAAAAPAPIDPDPDRDDDAIDDAREPPLGGRPDRADTDGDGWIDGVELLAGTALDDPASRPGPAAALVTLPPDGGERAHEVPFHRLVEQADVLFLLDTTGSMGGAIDAVRRSLADVVVPGLAASLASFRLGLAELRDFARDGHGAAGDVPFRLRVPLGEGAEAVRAGLDALEASGGGDRWEAVVEAVARAGDGACEGGGGFGEACFEPAALPVVVAITDAPSHNGVDPARRYAFPARDLVEASLALAARGVRVLGVAVRPVARPDLEALAVGTGAVGASGTPHVIDAPEGRVGEAVVEVVEALVAGLVADVSLAVGRGAGARWVRAVRAEDTTPPARSVEGARLRGVPGGARGRFSLVLAAGDRDLWRARVRRLDLRVHASRAPETLVAQTLYLVVPPYEPPLR